MTKTKHVFANASEVAHLWAHGIQEWARYRDNFYFEGRNLYSYGTHYLAGYRIADSIVALNSESYSVTTSKHNSEARSATRHMIQLYLPDLQSMKRALEFATDTLNESGAARRHNGKNADAVKQFQEVIRANWPEVQAESARTFAQHIGITGKQFESFIAGLEKKAAADKAAEKKEATRISLKLASDIAGLSDSEFRATFPGDSEICRESAKAWFSEPLYRTREIDISRAHKAASKAGKTRIKKQVWQKLTDYRDHAAGANARLWQIARDRVAADVWQWRKEGGDSPFIPYGIADKIPAIVNRIDKVNQARKQAEHDSAFAAWQSGDPEAKRPWANYYKGEPEKRELILADARREVTSALQAFDAWQASGQEGEPPILPRRHAESIPEAIGAETMERLNKASLEVFTVAEKRKREAKEAEKQARLNAWLTGESSRSEGWTDSEGGALLRVIGDNESGLLETSQGANVPIRHAILAYRFVKACRLESKGWRRNGQTIRVGHYQLDSIDSKGNFQAGCHRINWQEISRIAESIGVADLSPKSLTRSPRPEAVAAVDNNAFGERNF